MKKKLFLITAALTGFLSTASCFAGTDWSHMSVFARHKEKFLSTKLVERTSPGYEGARKSQIHYCTFLSDADKEWITESEMLEQVQIAFIQWFKASVNLLPDWREFDEVREVLNRPVYFVNKGKCDMDVYKGLKTAENAPDVAFIFDTEGYCAQFFEPVDGKQVAGNLNFLKKPLNICINKIQNSSRVTRDNFAAPHLMKSVLNGKYPDVAMMHPPSTLHALTHELGHAFALGDEYTYEFRDKIYSTSFFGKGIMGLEGRLTSDDALSLAAMIDRVLHGDGSYGPPGVFLNTSGVDAALSAAREE
jgi:hypothetical protein